VRIVGARVNIQIKYLRNANKDFYCLKPTCSATRALFCQGDATGVLTNSGMHPAFYKMAMKGSSQKIIDSAHKLINTMVAEFEDLISLIPPPPKK
jgi:hypothetical protein